MIKNNQLLIKPLCFIYIILSPLLAYFLYDCMRGYWAIGGEGLLIIAVGIYLMFDFINELYDKARDASSLVEEVRVVDLVLLRKRLYDAESSEARRFALDIVNYCKGEMVCEWVYVDIFKQALNISNDEFIKEYTIETEYVKGKVRSKNGKEENC